MPQAVKTILSFLLRLGLSAGLLVWLFRKIDISRMWAALQGADAGYMTAAGLVFIFLNFVILGRWRIFMSALDLKIPLGSATRWFFIGLFCNLFLPTAIGGDVIRAIGLCRESDDKPKVFASILIDRLSGFAGIVIIAAVMFAFGYKLVQAPAVVISIAALTALSMVTAAVLFNERFFSLASKVFGWWPKFREALMKMHYDIALLKARPAKGFLGVGISALNQIVLAFMFYLIARALHQDIDFMYFLIFSPLVCVTASIPSIGGLGVREIGWAYLFAKVGLSQDIAVSMSLISFLFMIVIGIVGGIVYVVTLSSGRVQHHPSAAGVQPKKI